MEDEAIAKAVSNLLKNADDEEMTYDTHRPLDATRRKIMATAFEEVGSMLKLFEVLAKKGQDTREFTVGFKGDGWVDPEVIMGSCQIMFDDLTPSECIEYCFAEEPDVWFMAKLSQEALETYRGMKFEAWRKMLVEPTCEAQFRRMLQIGMITELYDPQVFPTPEAHKSTFQVTDERTGKLIELPHPVRGLRVWNASTQAYTTIETRLTGAPSVSEVDKWWGDFVQELNSKHGAEYISGLMSGR